MARRDDWKRWLAGALKGNHHDQLVKLFDPAYWDRQGLLLLSFSFATGIAVYAQLPSEPFWPLLVALCIAGFAVVLWPNRAGPAGRLVLLALFLLLGLASGATRTALVDAPKLAEPMNVTLTGQILERQNTNRTNRLVIRVTSVNGISTEEIEFPERVRLRVPAESTAGIGETVRLRARLFPPAGPVSPGSYDYSYRAFYQRIGATGFAFGSTEKIDGDSPGFVLTASRWVHDMRAAMVGRVQKNIGVDRESALVAALLVGDRSGIDEETEEKLRAAGLAHILAISGLHMALFAGGAFSASLFFMALCPPLALRWPLHKWAAVIALIAALFYLVLSGAAVATQRSFLMISLVFLGVLTGRRGLTLRSVALAAMVLLIIAPERLFSPGFQMSFAAVIALVAVYDMWRERQRHTLDIRVAQTLPGRIGGALVRWCAGLLVTAFVAGLATGIVGAHHFGRVAPYGLLGNLLGMPVFTLIVMPSGVLALVLMPLGLAQLPLEAMSFGLNVLLEIAAFTANLGGDAGVMGKLNTAAFLLLSGALFSGLLLPGRLKAVFVLPLGLGIAAVAFDRPPDIQIASTGSRVAVRSSNGDLVYAPRRRSFATDLWMQEEGVANSAIKARTIKSDQRRCDADGCVVHAYALSDDRETAGSTPLSLTIAQPKTLSAFDWDCKFADIIVSDITAPESCAARYIFDRYYRAKRGAISIWLTSTGQSAEAPATTVGALEAQSALSRGHHRQTTNQGGIVIEKIVFAIPDPPRPWHAKGTVTRTSLRQQNAQTP